MPESTTEPIVEPTVEEPNIDRDIDGLLAVLEKADVAKPEQLEGKLRASKEAGQLANLLGTVKAENQELRDLIKGLNKPSKPKDEWDDTSAQPIDIEDVVKRSVKSALYEEKKAQSEQQQRMLQQYNKITTDKHYGLVKEAWENKLKDPNFVMGNVDLTEEYKNTVIDFYMGVSKQAGDTIRRLKPGTVNPPHMEGEGATPKTKPPTPEKQEKLKKLQEQAGKGRVYTDDEIIDSFDVLLG